MSRFDQGGSILLFAAISKRLILGDWDTLEGALPPCCGGSLWDTEQTNVGWGEENKKEKKKRHPKLLI